MVEDIKTAVITAGGMGIRLFPATRSQSKEMLTVFDKPVLHYVVEEAAAAGLTKVVIVTGRNTESVQQYFSEVKDAERLLRHPENRKRIDRLHDLLNSVKITCVQQPEPRGLGDAVACAADIVDGEPFLLMLGDTIYIHEIPAARQIVEAAKTTGFPMIGVERVPEEYVQLYGIVEGNSIGDDLHQATRIVEKPDADAVNSNLAIAGRYALSGDIFEYLDRTEPGVSGEIELTDALAGMVKDRAVYAVEIKGHRYDVGSRMGRVKATIDLALQKDGLDGELGEYLRQIIEAN